MPLSVALSPSRLCFRQQRMTGNRQIVHLEVFAPGQPGAGGRTEGVVYVAKGSLLRFVYRCPEADWDTRSPPRVHTNLPEPGQKFDRSTVREIVCEVALDECCWMASTVVELAGSFEYHLQLPTGAQGRRCSLVVPPQLTSPALDAPLSPDEICSVTMVTKCMGGVKRWRSLADTAARMEYNMIHFTPMQKLGLSGSAYSLLDQQKLSDQLLPPGETLAANVTEEEREERKEKELASFVRDVREKRGVFCMSDVVWNHTACNSPWIREHPEACYNLENSPHLRPAYALDRALHSYSQKAVKRREIIQSVEDVDRVVREIAREVLPALKMWEFFVVDVALEVHRFRTAVEQIRAGEATEADLAGPAHSHHPYSSSLDSACVIDANLRRGGKRVQLSCALRLFNDSGVVAALSLEERCNMYRRALDKFNLALYKQWDADQEALLKNLRSTLIYERVAEHGPRRAEVTARHPLFERYFTVLSTSTAGCTPASLVRQTSILDEDVGAKEEEEEEETVPRDLGDARIDGAHHIVAANAGWVWGGSSGKDFAAAGSVYLRRELIVWSDSVKLRYGSAPADCPFLWQWMRQYTCSVAAVFDGLRIDNCHSTPLHVAQYMLDAAREVNSDLFVAAELFTGDKQRDADYCAALGLSALIRESMQCESPKLLAERTIEYSGGQFFTAGGFEQPGGSVTTKMALPQPPLCIFMDCTHDNEVPVEKRSAPDYLPNAAIVAMANCSIGSTFGYDQLVPHRISVVEESRLYKLDLPVTSMDGPLPTFLAYPSHGMEVARQALNQLHRRLAHGGFGEIEVRERDGVVCVMRHNPTTDESIYLFANTAFEKRNPNARVEVPPMPYSGLFKEELIASVLRVQKSSYVRDPNVINGMVPTMYWTEAGSSVPCKSLYELADGMVRFIRFPPGSVIAFSVSMSPAAQNATVAIRGLTQPSALGEALASASLLDLNHLLFRCAAEEESVNGRSAYDVPGYGRLVFCGLAGIEPVLREAREANAMHHPICQNIRDGLWILQYLTDRLRNVPGLAGMRKWLTKALTHVRLLPPNLLPKYVDLIVRVATLAAKEKALEVMPTFVRDGDAFVQSLALVSVQLFSHIPSAPLCAEALLLDPYASSPSLAAGLPHFSTGFMRNWGRDTFISLRGLFLVTGRLAEAKELLLAYAACVRHGLIPNLLDGGKNPRYNARDATWWWLQALQDYCSFAFASGDEKKDAEDTVAFLSGTKVELYFPLVDVEDKVMQTEKEKEEEEEKDAVKVTKEENMETETKKVEKKVEKEVETAKEAEEEEEEEEEVRACVSLLALVEHILQSHAAGISFRERGAGPQLDNKMQDPGFNVSVTVDCATGFVQGGNEWNCGTWMDKMGESQAAGNWGVPATPRDGAAIELVGLQKSTTRWLAGLARFTGKVGGSVVLSNGEEKTYEQWDRLVQENFEKRFFVPRATDGRVVASEEVQFASRRGIYKDTVGSSRKFTDYQLRPNQCIAMAVAPELFEQENAAGALQLIGSVLAGPLGMRTLDPADWKYQPYYHPEQEGNYDTAKGFNYHQGPEWVWLFGFYLRALVNFRQEASKVEMRKKLSWLLRPHREALAASRWLGLTELTNKDGQSCAASCPTQAWSAATILDALHTAETL